MADIKWIKLATNMHEDEKMRLIDAMPERDTVHYVWIRLLLLAGKTNANGEIFLSGDMPLTSKMLAVLFSRPLATVKLALKTLSRLGMIEIAPNKIIRIVNWNKHQNIEGMEKVREQNRKRAENHREKKKQEKNATKSGIEENYKDEVVEARTLDENEELEVNNISDNSDEKLNANAKNAPINYNNNNDSSETTIDNDKNNCNVTENTSNVTRNESNVTVTEQNKKKIEKKNKKDKRDIESEEDNNLIQLKGNNESNKLTDGKTSYSADISNQSLKEKLDDIKVQNKILEKYEIQSVDPDLSEGTARLSKYHESITGKIGVLESGKLRGAIALHGEANVKMAIDAAIKVDKAEMGYINGILSNWRREGYPKDNMEVKRNGIRSTGKSNTTDKNEFAGFKPKEPRKLTADERKKIEANLI